LALRPTATTIHYKNLIRPSQGSDRLRLDFGVRVGLMAVVVEKTSYLTLIA
jgi:hypothetical protein